VAWVGATENDAKAAGLTYGTGVFPWAAAVLTIEMGADAGASG